MNKASIFLVAVILLFPATFGCSHPHTNYTPDLSLRDALKLATRAWVRDRSDYPVLEELGLYSRWEESDAASSRLSDMLEKDPRNIERLLELVNDPDPDVRYSATLTMVTYSRYGRFGEGVAINSLPAIAGGLDDHVIAVRLMSAYATYHLIMRLKEPYDPRPWDTTNEETVLREIAPEILDTLDDPIPAMRLSTVRLIRDIGPGASEYIYALEPLLEDENQHIRVAAASAFARVSGDAEKAMPVLMESLESDLESEDWGGRGMNSYSYYEIDRLPVAAQAAEALAVLGPGARDAIPMLLERLDSENFYIRGNVSNAIALIGEPLNEIIPALITKFDNSDPVVREIAASTLGKLGPVAFGALPALRTLTEDPDRNVRGSARLAIEMIENQAWE